MLTVHYSNRLEILADRMADVLSTPLRSPLAPEIVTLQSGGVARWLSLQLAQRRAICANVRFLFPAELLWYVFEQTLANVPHESQYDAATLTWRLLAQLDAAHDDVMLGSVAGYLADGDPLKRYQLARRLGEVFEQYLVFRSDWIRAWEQAEPGDWQARLWCRLVDSGDSRHWVRLQREFLDRAARGELPTQRLPQRVALFAITSLSPAYLNIIEHLGRYIDVHVFVLNPCAEYWGDIVTERQQSQLMERAPEVTPYLEIGNSLLASMGLQARDFIDLLQELSPQESDHFVAPREANMLCCLQSDIYALKERGADGQKTEISRTDRSVQVHVCHSPMREVEVLYDQLLDLFARDAELTPSDVIVVTPDIESYAPYIEAVFATRDAERRFPYTLADRGLRAESPLVEGLFRLLDMGSSRYDANTVLALLELPAVQRRFGISEMDLETIYRWVRESGIRWGIDGASRAELNLPASAEHSWHAGMKRLLLGYALPQSECGLFKGVLPCGAPEGAEAQVLGRLQTYLETLFALKPQLTKTASIADWGRTLAAILDGLFDMNETEVAELRPLREASTALAETAERAAYGASVSLEVFKAELSHRLERSGPGSRFLAGAVTFCSMVPMRSIPFKLVCMIGLNDGCFPRVQRPYSFDRMGQTFRRGDRSRSDDDRLLFLETLISARQCLYISYVGRDMRDDSVLPPSVLVSELLDYLGKGFRLAGGGDIIAQHIVLEHPLQAFSARYYEGDIRLFTYSHDLARASEIATQRGTTRGLLFDARLPEAEAEWRRVEIDDLVRFFFNPTRYLLRQRLDIWLHEGETALETREPFVLNYSATRFIRQELLACELGGGDVTAVFERMRAAGLLPHGTLGESVFAAEQSVVKGFARRLRGRLPTCVLPPQHVELELGDMCLYGQLTQVSELGLLDYSVAKTSAYDWSRLWIHHLVLNALTIEGEKLSYFFAQDTSVRLKPVNAATELLAELLALYWEGLHRPLPFFPRSALHYVQASREPLRKARSVWWPSEYHRGEADESYFQLVFAGTDPLDEEFECLAQTVFKPMLAHREDL